MHHNETCSKIIEALKEKSTWADTLKNSPIKCQYSSNETIMLSIPVPDGLDGLVDPADTWEDLTGEDFNYSLQVCGDNDDCILLLHRILWRQQTLIVENEINRVLEENGIPYRVIKIWDRQNRVIVHLYRVST